MIKLDKKEENVLYDILTTAQGIIKHKIKRLPTNKTDPDMARFNQVLVDLHQRELNVIERVLEQI